MPANPTSHVSLAGPDFHPKIAIPRLHHGRSKRKETNDTNRVPRACANCRRRKVKCSAGLPRCRNCHEQDIECAYPTARKDRLQAAKEQNGELVRLLRDLSIRVSDGDKMKINCLLDTVEEEDVILPSPRSSNIPVKRQRTETEIDSDLELGNTDESTSASLPEDGDMNNQDWSQRRDSKIGSIERQRHRPFQKSLRTANQPNAFGHLATFSDPEVIFHITDWAFYLDKDSLELDDAADPLELPVPAEAQRLFDLFVETIHITFPLISKGSVEEDLRRCYDPSDSQCNGNQTDERQKVNLNLIFAIASYHSSLMGSSEKTSNADHLVYYTRARLLGLNDSDIMTAHPDLPLIQGTGLLALYYLIIGHLSRAWVAIGLSLRLAMAIGLQLPLAEHPTSEQDTRARMWWGLRNIEFLLSSATGRSSVTSDDYCTIPLSSALLEANNFGSHVSTWKSGRDIPNCSTSPTDSPSDPKSQGSFITDYTKIGHITQRVITQLYSPRSASKTCENIYPVIKSLKGKLDQWALEALPPSSTLIALHSTGSKSSREMIRLELYYTSTMILITKPCLYQRRRRSNAQNAFPREFGQKMATKCIEAAKRMVLILSYHSDRASRYGMGPWWSIMHNMMQALTVFLHEMSYEDDPHGSEDDQISHYANQLIRWIRTLRDCDDAAEKAYQVVQQILENCHGRVNILFSTLLEDEKRTDMEIDQSYKSLANPMHQSIDQNRSTSSVSTADRFKTSNSSMHQTGYTSFGPQPSDMDFAELGEWNWQYSPVFDEVFANPFASQNLAPRDPSVSFSQSPLDVPPNVPHQQSAMDAPSNAPFQRHPQAAPSNASHFQVPVSTSSTAPHYQEYECQERASQGFPQVNQMKQHHYFPL